MDDFNRLAGHAVENLVAIAPHHMHADIGIIRCADTTTDVRRSGGCSHRCVQDVARAGRAVLFEKPINGVDVGERQRAVSPASCQAAALPERFDLVIGREWTRRAASMAARSSSLRR